MSTKLKVYYPVPSLGPSIRRRRVKLIEYLPGNIEIVAEPEAADLQLQSICLAGELAATIQHERFILFLHNAPTLLGPGPEALQDALGRATGVASWSEYPKFYQMRCRFIRAPQGADPDVFRPPKGDIRNCAIATTGFLGTYYEFRRVEGEPILEAHQAAKNLDKRSIQIGPHIHDLPEGLATGFIENDYEVARHYGMCHFVSGLRWWGGFECPSLEGLLCGCRPICFDLPDERYWWGEHAFFVKHDPVTLVEQLEDVIRFGANPVTYAERDYLARKFGWKSVAKEFWGFVLSVA